jgi:hypothetical protein
VAISRKVWPVRRKDAASQLPGVVPEGVRRIWARAASAASAARVPKNRLKYRETALTDLGVNVGYTTRCSSWGRHSAHWHCLEPMINDSCLPLTGVGEGDVIDGKFQILHVVRTGGMGTVVANSRGIAASHRRVRGSTIGFRCAQSGSACSARNTTTARRAPRGAKCHDNCIEFSYLRGFLGHHARTHLLRGLQ